MNRAALLGIVSLGLAGGAGVLGAVAFSQTSQQTPTRTVTISVENGATGPTGPQGPAGPPGPAGTGSECPAGSEFGKLVINAPGGQVTIWTCIGD